MKAKRNADIIDVANRAGVSIATVSRTFNHPDLVRADTRFRIMEAVEATGYIRNRAASAIHGKTSGTIGLLVPTIDNSIFSRLIQSFSETLNGLGYTMLISTNGYDLELEHAQLRNLLEHRVDAIAWVGLEHTDRSYKLIKSRRTPAVALWNYDEDSSISCVGADNREAGRIAARHIVDLGHRDIAVLFPPDTGNDRARDRLLGAVDVLKQHRIKVSDDWRMVTKYDTAQALDVTLDLLGRKRRPTAVIAGNDIIARGAIAAALRLGLNVPEDVSIIGIGDFAGSAEMVPSLTTVSLDAGQTGSLAAKLLVEDLIQQDPEKTVRIQTKSELVARQSTAISKS